MTAASYWSLLNPAIEMAEKSGAYGENGQWAFFPVAVGFLLGAVFVWGTDSLMPLLVSMLCLHVHVHVHSHPVCLTKVKITDVQFSPYMGQLIAFFLVRVPP